MLFGFDAKRRKYAKYSLSDVMKSLQINLFQKQAINTKVYYFHRARNHLKVQSSNTSATLFLIDKVKITFVGVSR